MNKKIIIFVTAMVLVFAMVTGATFAYFTSLAGDVTNTFVSGNFGKVYIQEINDDGDTNVTGFSDTKQNKTNKYTVIPGKAINKNPQIKFDFTDTTPITGAYIYVKIEYGAGWSYSSNKFTGTVNSKTSALSVSVNSTNWKQVATGTGFVVFCYKNAAQTADLNYTSVFSGNITVANTLTEEDCKWFADTSKYNLDLKFSAYAVQQGSFASAAEAWNNCGKNLNTQA